MSEQLTPCFNRRWDSTRLVSHFRSNSSQNWNGYLAVSAWVKPGRLRSRSPFCRITLPGTVHPGREHLGIGDA